MATQAEIVADLNAAKTSLDNANTKLTKVGAETDALKARIAVLEEAVNNQTNASPELIAAAAAVKESVTTLEATLTAVDDKVPDAPAN